MLKAGAMFSGVQVNTPVAGLNLAPAGSPDMLNVTSLLSALNLVYVVVNSSPTVTLSIC